MKASLPKILICAGAYVAKNRLQATLPTLHILARYAPTHTGNIGKVPVLRRFAVEQTNIAKTLRFGKVRTHTYKTSWQPWS